MRTDTSNYEWTYGVKPRGTGQWVFMLNRGESWTEFAVPYTCLYSEAKKVATAEARSLGCTEMVVAT